MNTSTSLNTNIWKFYLITALGIRFIAPIRILYLLSFGLNFTQIGIMELAASITVLVLEIPTGLFADIFGRKTSRLIAYVLSIAAFSIMSMGSTWPVFIFGWILSGAADAFQSGAQDALIFDTLKSLNRTKDYIKLKSHFYLINTFSVVVGSIAGSYLYSLNRRLPWYLITGTIILSALVYMTIKEPKFAQKYQDFTGQFHQFKKSFFQVLESGTVRQLIIFGLILALPMHVFVTLLNQPYLLSVGYKVESLGIVFAIITLVSGLAASFSHKIQSYLSQQFSLLLITISLAVLPILFGLIQTSWVLLFVIIFYIMDGYKNIFLDNYLNLSIKSESRAAVLSVQSFVNNLIISLVFVFVGHLADTFSINIVLIALGTFVATASLPFWLSKKPQPFLK